MSISHDVPTKIEEVFVVPNTSGTAADIDIYLNRVDNVLIDVLDLEGNSLRSLQLKNSDSYLETIPILHLRAGIYIIQVTASEDTRAARLLVPH